MKNGDIAGLGAYCAEPGLISVVMEDDAKYLVMTDRGEEKARTGLTAETVFLRMDCNFETDTATFFYSPDDEAWTQLGGDFRRIYNLVHFMGNRVAIYSYATQSPGGYVDVDFFRYTRF